MTTEKKQEFIISCLYGLLILLIGYVVMKYLFGLVLPFLIGFAIAFALRPVVEFLERKTGKRGKLWSALVLVLAYGVVCGLVALGCWKGVRELLELVEQLPEVYTGTLGPALRALVLRLAELARGISPELYESLLALTDSTAQTLGGLLTTFSGNVAGGIAAFAARVPSVLVTCAFAVISSAFFCLDYVNITRFIKRQVPQRYRPLITQVKGYLVGAFAKMTRAYLIILGITFLELLIGLSLLGMEYPATVAAVTALVDILPVFGTGVVLLPWALVELLRGQYYLAAGLVLLYLLVSLVRNFLEPKILGKQIGLHPIATLMALYVGAKLFGFAGLFLPVVLILVKNLNDTGVVSVWRE